MSHALCLPQHDVDGLLSPCLADKIHGRARDTQACTMQTLNAVRSSLSGTQNLMMQKSTHGRLHVQQCLES